MASSSSYAIKPKQRYDVFLSFRGEDTRHSFTSYLHAALQREKIETYMDDKKLERGDEITPALLKAIEESKIAVIIFSENYANSTWCLDELVHILECKQRHGQCVIPIFYEIDPSHVRNQKGSYGTAIAQLEQRFTDQMDKVLNWRTALGEAAKLAGLDSRNIRPESQLVDTVVKDILLKLKHEWSSDFIGLVGIENRIQEIESLLGSDPQDVCVRTVGIWGMGGIGKTTLAEVVFHRLSSQFESSCFIANVREESSERRDLYHLRDKLYRKLLRDEKLTIETPTIGDSFVKMRLSRTKVLIVLDDVNDSSQSAFLVGNQVQFGPGSRIIVTTRDMQLLKKRAGEDIKIYEVKELKSEEAIELFHLNAFRGIHSTTESMQFSRMVVDYSTGLPLALTVLGSIFLHCNSKEERESELRKLKKFPNKKIQNVLRASYDGLEENEKELFLDIACFYKAKEIHDAKRQLNACGLFADRGIGVLVDMSLVSIKNNQLWMHDIIQEMGWEIVREQCYQEPGKRSRLYNPKDVCHVFERNTGSAAVRGISLHMAGLRTLNLTPQAFTEMHNLRFLMFYDHPQYCEQYCTCNVCTPQGLESLPNALGYLSWLRYPMTSLPSKFSAENLVELHLRHSNLQRLCLQNARNLKRIDLSYSIDLVEVLEFTKSLESITLEFCLRLVQVPDLSKSVNIESINFESCRGLLAIPSYFKIFTQLTSLNLCDCEKIKCLPEMPSNIEFLNLKNTAIEELPSSIWSLEKLVGLDLSRCWHIRNILPNSTWKLNSLQSLVLDCTRIERLPTSIDQCLSRVVSISLQSCRSFVSLPTSICKLKSLERLDLKGCDNFDNFPEILEPMQHLEFLSLMETEIETLPLSITNLVGLKTLQLAECKRLRSLPNLPHLLEKLDANGCSSLEIVDSSSMTVFPHGLDQIICDPSYVCRHEERMFSSCLNLNQNSRWKIMDEARIRIVRMATAILAKPDAINFVQNFYKQHYRFPFSVNVICPGNKIPEWFSCETEGRSINIKLPLHWYDANFLGFAVSAVVTRYHAILTSECTSSFKTTDGKSCDFSSTLYSYKFPGLRYARDNADDVLVWYQPFTYKHGGTDHLANATEASFHFIAINSEPMDYDRGTIDTNTVVHRCGVCFLYSQANAINFQVIDR